MFLITDNFPRSTCHHDSEPLGLEHDPAVLSLSIAKLGLPCVGCCVAIPNDARLSVNDKSHYVRYTLTQIWTGFDQSADPAKSFY